MKNRISVKTIISISQRLTNLHKMFWIWIICQMTRVLTPWDLPGVVALQKYTRQKQWSFEQAPGTTDGTLLTAKTITLLTHSTANILTKNLAHLPLTFSTHMVDQAQMHCQEYMMFVIGQKERNFWSSLMLIKTYLIYQNKPECLLIILWKRSIKEMELFLRQEIILNNLQDGYPPGM